MLIITRASHTEIQTGPGRVVVEIKATERLHRDASRQLRNYLRATRLEVGLLLHFGRDPNFTRVIYENALKPSSS